MISYKSIRADVSQEMSYVYEKVKQYDNLSRKYRIMITDKGNMVSLKGNEAIRIRMWADGESAPYIDDWLDEPWENGYPILIMTSRMLSKVGKVKYEFVIQEPGSPAVISTRQQNLLIQKSLIDYDGIIASEDFDVLSHLIGQATTIPDLINDINVSLEDVSNKISEVNSTMAEYERQMQTYATEYEEMKTDMQDVIDALHIYMDNVENAAASSATLSRSWAVGNTNSRDGEDANNSKYYSDQSKTYSEASKASADRAEQYAGRVDPKNLSQINAVDSSGLLGTVGATVTGQKLSDEISNRVATKLLQKSEFNTSMSSIDLQLAQKANQTDLNVTNANIALKANKTDLDIQKNRIDNILALPVGTDNAETADIRIGADGINYPSAGNAVRTQLTGLGNQLPLVNPLFKYYSSFSAKRYDNTSKTFVNATNILSLITPIALSYDIVIRVKSGYQFAIFYWEGIDTTGGYTSISSYTTTTRTIKAGSYFTLSFSQVANGTITIAELSNIYSDKVTDLNESTNFSITTINTNLAVINENNNKIFTLYGLFKAKRYDVNIKAFVDVNYQLSIITPIAASDDITVRVKSGYQFIVLYWDSTDTSAGFTSNSGWTTAEKIIRKDALFTLSLSKVNNTTIVSNEISNLYCDTFEDIKDEMVDIKNEIVDIKDEISDTNSLFDNLQKNNLYAAFRKVGVIGDSYSSVRLYDVDSNGTITSAGDVAFYSWGKFLERKSGMSYNIFAKGGLETSQWLTDADKGYPVASLHENLCQAYIIFLGINDSSRHNNSYIGSTNDINMSDPDLNANSFYGNYAKIIQKMKELVPKVKFFLITMPVTTQTGLGDRVAYNDAIRILANIFDNVYLIDLQVNYYDIFNNEFFNVNTINGHWTPPAFQYMAEIIASEISKIMYNNPTEFALIEFIGNGYLS